MTDRKLRMGMIGGGKGSFIGIVHHMAAVLDNQIELVCGAFSSNPEVSAESGNQYFLPSDRVYGNYDEMIRKESLLPEGIRMDFVAIVTPNYVHFDPAKKALENGFHVICDKPLTFNLDEALDLENIKKKTGKIFAVTHAYCGYPMVKEAREIIKGGQLGKVRKVMVEYPQGWLSGATENTGNKQAGWRTDPNKSGISCTMGDIGVHAANLAEYITSLRITEICADINTFVPGRQLDDDGSVLLKFNSEAKGVLTASQVCAGEENALKIQVYGEKGGLEWHQMEPNSLILKWPDKPKEIRRTGWGPLSEASLKHIRVPAGHPEGYIEAFANIYRNFAMAVRKNNQGLHPDPIYDFPGIEEGVRGMKFITSVIKSGKSDQKWIKIED